MKPIVIAHRGASGYLPEHTLEAYELAVKMGADFIEPDLVITKDGMLIARHENELSLTTDVAGRPEFATRRTTRLIEGQSVTGWFAEDFTLAEIKSLRARQRFPFRDNAHDGLYLIPTFDEIIALAQQLGPESRRPIGVYPETKFPAYFRSIGLPLEEPLVASLKRAGWGERSSPVFVQSFDAQSLRWLRERTRVRLIQLVGDDTGGADETRARDGSPITDEALRTIATYADGVGVAKRLIIPVNPDRTARPPTNLVQRAHRHGLLVHVWTFRNESQFHPGFASPADELHAFLQTGVDGVFADFPDTAADVVSKRVKRTP
jgi:glycerophosphoryl diester phosphodiesterase